LAAKKEFGGECPKDICLRREAFSAWKTFWGMKNVPPNPHSTSHDDYHYCLKLAKKIMAKRKPNNQNDPTQNALYYVCDSLTSRKKYKSAVLIGGNLYLKTFSNLACY
jgi:hypothetical protein